MTMICKLLHFIAHHQRLGWLLLAYTYLFGHIGISWNGVLLVLLLWWLVLRGWFWGQIISYLDFLYVLCDIFKAFYL